MNNENLEFLKNQVKYMGFGERFNEQLEQNLQNGKPEFQLRMESEYDKDKFEAQLYFRKSDTTDMYFFNKYDAAYLKEGNMDNKLSQTFYVNGKGINNTTAKEAFNLLEGRAVQQDLTTREGVEYKAWVQLDFDNNDDRGNFKSKQFHENYGYDLKDAVGKLPIKELGDTTQSERLMKSLEKGNIQSVTFEKDGKEERMFISANPQFKSINVYDSQMKPVLSEKQQQAIDAKKGESKSNGQEQAKEKNVKQETPKKNSKEKPDSLLPKKREGSGKSMKV